MRIAIDSMGGDRAPAVVIDGALSALRQMGPDLEVVLVGRREEILADAAARGVDHTSLEIIDAADVVAMDEKPSATLRKKKQSSIAVALRMQREGLVDGFVSAGNTGAVVANALFTLGRIPGVARPAIATFIPTRGGGCILLDVGSNIESKSAHLFQYAMMGSCYAHRILDRAEPRVGLLNVGEERSKGGTVIREAFDLLESSDINFVGNVEGKDIFTGAVDVVVCDGFVGNVVLKFTESIVDMVYGVMREEITSNLLTKAGALLLKPAFRRLRAAFDYAEYGGAPLLGVDGVLMICHGGSSVRAIENAVVATCRIIEYDVNSAIRERLGRYESKTARGA